MEAFPVTIPHETYHGLVQYLATRPFGEVVGLMQALGKAYTESQPSSAPELQEVA